MKCSDKLHFNGFTCIGADGRDQRNLGGLLADVLSNTVPDLFKPGELYATACLIGGIIYILLVKAGLTYEVNLVVCVFIVFAVRIASKLKRLKLPRI